MRIVLFHSILGLRDAELRIADAWTADGHLVILPDLYDGRTVANYDDGFALKDEIGDETIRSRAIAAVDELPGDVVLAGVSFGASLIGALWKRPNVAGAILLAGAAAWMEPRRPLFPVSAHVARPDPFDDEAYFAQWVDEAGPVDLAFHRYDGAGHYFLDESLPDHDATAAALCLDRTLVFLRRYWP